MKRGNLIPPFLIGLGGSRRRRPPRSTPCYCGTTTSVKLWGTGCAKNLSKVLSPPSLPLFMGHGMGRPTETTIVIPRRFCSLRCSSEKEFHQLKRVPRPPFRVQQQKTAQTNLFLQLPSPSHDIRIMTVPPSLPPLRPVAACVVVVGGSATTFSFVGFPSIPNERTEQPLPSPTVASRETHHLPLVSPLNGAPSYINLSFFFELFRVYCRTA